MTWSKRRRSWILATFRLLILSTFAGLAIARGRMWWRRPLNPVPGCYVFSRIVLRKAAAGERMAMLGLPAWRVMTRIGRLFTNRALMTQNAWRATASTRIRTERMRPEQYARRRPAIASPAICPSMRCRKRTQCSQITRFAWSVRNRQVVHVRYFPLDQSTVGKDGRSISTTGSV